MAYLVGCGSKQHSHGQCTLQQLAVADVRTTALLQFRFLHVSADFLLLH
jgi:hypothetical protein